MFNAAVSDERINLIVEAINGEGKVAKADYCNDNWVAPEQFFNWNFLESNI